MPYNIFDDTEMFDEVMQKSEQIKARAIKEKKDIKDVVKQESQAIFDTIKNLINEEVENNKKSKYSEKYADITEIVEIMNTAELLRKEKLSLRERKIA